MPEGSSTNVTATTRPVVGPAPTQAPAGAPRKDGNLDGLRKKYDDLAKQTSDASRSGAEPREVERLKAQKLEAFNAWKKAETDEGHARRDANRSGGRREQIDPGSPIVAQ